MQNMRMLRISIVSLGYLGKVVQLHHIAFLFLTVICEPFTHLVFYSWEVCVVCFAVTLLVTISSDCSERFRNEKLMNELKHLFLLFVFSAPCLCTPFKLERTIGFLLNYIFHGICHSAVLN